ncbi:MAG: response regulator transcription factor [Cellulosilyticaceae bacterium]
MINDIYECKILIVDDEIELLHMVERILRKEGFSKIHIATTCKMAQYQAEMVRPELIVLDVMLPDGDGFNLMKKLRESTDAPILFLSARDEDENRLLGLGLGADDYITKPFLPRELILRLGIILRRTYLRQNREIERKKVIQLGSYQVDFNTGNVTNGQDVINLTAKEYALLEKLYENHGNIVTGDTLCMAAWGDGLYGYENTLMVHIRRLRAKIEEEPSSPRHLVTVRGLGYKLVKVVEV